MSLRKIFLAVMPCLILACSSAGQPRYEEQNYDDEGNLEISVGDEETLSGLVIEQVQKDYPAINNSTLQDYVNHLGQQIVQANGLDQKPYHYSFTVVSSKYVNAFSLPGGAIFITAPLLDLVETEAELAGVLGHEIGHVKAHHIAEHMEKEREERTNSWYYAVGDKKNNTKSATAKLCAKEDKSCLALAHGHGGNLLIQKYAFMANSRQDEVMADRTGYQTAVAAGFSKAHVGNFYSKLYLMEEERKQKKLPLSAPLVDIMATHPPSQERIVQMRELATQTPEQSSPIISGADFKEAQKIARQWIKENI